MTFNISFLFNRKESSNQSQEMSIHQVFTKTRCTCLVVFKTELDRTQLSSLTLIIKNGPKSKQLEIYLHPQELAILLSSLEIRCMSSEAKTKTTKRWKISGALISKHNNGKNLKAVLLSWHLEVVIVAAFSTIVW